MRKRAIPKRLVGLALCLAAIAPSAWPQAEVFLEIRKGERFKVPIAIDDFTWQNLDPLVFQGRQRAEEILADDLHFSDAFIVVRHGMGDEIRSSLKLDMHGMPVDRPIQARVRGEIVRDGRQMRLTGTLVDENSRETIFERRYEIGWDAERLEADRWGLHRFADEVTFFLTGTRGCAATRIAFVRADDASRELLLIDWDGRNETAATRLGNILLAPAWHPEGEALAFTSYHTGRPRLYAVELPGGDVRLLSDWDTPTAAAYSPDGKRIAFSTTRDENAEVYVARTNGSRAKRLTYHIGIDTAPSWSPSGKRIVFTSDRTGSPHLFTINADGTDLKQLTFVGQWNDSPDWSPTADRVVHVCRIDGEFELALIHADGRGWRRLTMGGGCENPRWGPDGRHIVFARMVAGRRGLWILDPDSGSLRRLTRSNRESYNPAWSRPARNRLFVHKPGG